LIRGKLLVIKEDKSKELLKKEGMKNIYDDYYECLNNQLIYNYIFNNSDSLRVDMTHQGVGNRK
jgi:hypothetical protein